MSLLPRPPSMVFSPPTPVIVSLTIEPMMFCASIVSPVIITPSPGSVNPEMLIPDKSSVEAPFMNMFSLLVSPTCAVA
ncbi:hypothetical protein DS909_22130 [Phaeobacter gallaeciensis]|uniref:Uncharacterized protein n=1 Tax=Phaeobacter gallaeciensis TaxID=60890 RepID=A0A366WLR3_9RHOB|nr:hypothetical protein DS909_22130 [Phaeobacter gallaeciensis]